MRRTFGASWKRCSAHLNRWVVMPRSSSGRCATTSRRSVEAMLTMSEILLLDSGVWIATVDETDRFAAASRELVLRTSRQAAALDLTLYEIANVVGSRWKRQEKARLLCRSVQLQCEEAMVRVDADLIVSTIRLDVALGPRGFNTA